MKGKRKFELCGRTVWIGAMNSNKCKLHNTADTLLNMKNYNRCNVKILKGFKRNTSCNRPLIKNGVYCKIHQRQEDNKPENNYMEHEIDAYVTEQYISTFDEKCVLFGFELDEKLRKRVWANTQQPKSEK